MGKNVSQIKISCKQRYNHQTIKMSGHVSMMNDVLIAQMPAALLRSTMRYIVSQDSTARQLLVDHVRTRFATSPPSMPPGSQLFPPDGGVAALAEYLSTIRCLFSCHMVIECLPYLAHTVRTIKEQSVTWKLDSELERTLDISSADIVQAVQAVKESSLRPDGLEKQLLDLLRCIDECGRYCDQTNLSQPYARSQVQVADAISLLYPSLHLNGYATSGRLVKQLTVDFTAHSISTANNIETRLLGGKLRVPCMFNGLWQMSSPAWGNASSSKMDSALIDLVRNGLVAADMADHYGDAELVYGSFRNRLPRDIASQVVTATKWCVFAPLKEAVSEETVLAAVMERADRVGGRIELLQFHWQDYDNKDYLLAVKYLVEISQRRPELVLAIGLCNFDAQRTEEVCEYMLKETGEVGIVSNQVQYSLIDSRPIVSMAEVCEKYHIHLLTYGSFCGGFLSDRWLDKDAPDGYGEATKLTPSQRKYLDMIYTWGTWQDFMRLLNKLHEIAIAHDVEIANVATRWILQRPEVGAVIVDTEVTDIEEAALGQGREKVVKLYNRVGDCGQEYR